jgi:putative ABC transport system permease protein
MLGRNGANNFRNNLLTIPGVTEATVTPDVPTAEGQYWQEGWFPDASRDAKKAIVMTTLRVDEHYIPTLGMQIVKGRNIEFRQTHPRSC